MTIKIEAAIILSLGLIIQVYTQTSGHFESTGGTEMAVYGLNTGSIGTSYGGYFETDGSSGRAVFGLASSIMFENYGGWFKAKGISGRGVYGVASNSTGENYGGYFESASSSGRGVYGFSSKSTGTNYGGYFQAEGTTGRAVFGLATGTTQENYGGYFQAEGTTGRAVFGLAAGTTQENYGGWFKAKGIGGRGVYGEASDVNGTNYGGYFLSRSIRGRAVFGLAEYVEGGENYGGWFKGKGDVGGTGVYAWGKVFDFYADGPGMNYGSSSSKRWKTNVRNISNPIEKLRLLRGVYYDWDEDHGGHHDVGFIAEEVGEILPEIVDYELNGIDAKGMDYSKLTPLLVEAANAMRAEYQEQFVKYFDVINELNKRIVILEQQLKSNSVKSEIDN